MSKPPEPSPGRAARVRFPLVGKVILWFVLNVIFLVGVAALITQAQLRLGPESLLAGSAGERLQVLGEYIAAQLNDTPQEEWPDALRRISDEHRVPVAIFRNDGTRLAGELAALPPEVFEKLTELGLRGAGMGRGPDRPPPSAVGGGPRLFSKFIRRAGSPAGYWIGLRARVPDLSTRPPVPTTVMIHAQWLGSGRLLVDFKPWLLGGAGVLACSVLFWIPPVRGITRAIREMMRAAGDIAQGRFDTPIDARRSDELGQLGASLNHMADRLNEYVTGQKRFLGDVAHELCSPLARMELALGVLDQRADDKQRAYVEDVREEVRHMSGLVNELLSFSKAGVQGRDVALSAVPLAEIARAVVGREARDHAQVNVDIAPTLHVLAEPDLLARALGNVVRNAIRYAGDSGPIRIAAEERSGEIALTVTDHGPGVPPETLHRLFDAFFRPEAARTRETGGAGLGLAIVKTCIEACGGKVTARNIEPHGLEIEMRLQRSA